MNRAFGFSPVGNAARWLLIGGKDYPPQVEQVVGGELQSRFERRRDKGGAEVLIHPDYLTSFIEKTENAIMGAFAMRLIGVDGATTEELEDYAVSSEAVPNLEYVGGEPVPWRMLSVTMGANFLKITKMVQIYKDGSIVPSDTCAEMLEANPNQAYTVFPFEPGRLSYVDIGGNVNMRIHGVDAAVQVYQQYSPHYQDTHPV